MDYSMMEYQARQKSLVVTYLLWFFFAMFGAHRFYAGDRTRSAIAQLLCTVFVVGPPVTLVWIIVDAFLIPRWTREYNLALIDELRYQTPPPD